MHSGPQHPRSLTPFVAAVVFAAIAAFLIVSTWVPASRSLTHEQGVVLSVTRRPNAWYEARIVTASGVTLTCRAQRNPLAWASRCPIPALETIIGARVTVQHNGTTLYVIEHAGTTLLGFDEFRAAQATAVGIAALLLTMAGVALWRAS